MALPWTSRSTRTPVLVSADLRFQRITISHRFEKGRTKPFRPVCAAEQGHFNTLPPPPSLNGMDPRVRYNPAALAFLGDTVYEAFLRTHFYRKNTPIAAYVRNVKLMVNHESQAAALDVLMSSNLLTETELDVIRWTRSSGTIKVQREYDGLLYKKASALESLVAYLYLTDVKRLGSIMSAIVASTSQMKSQSSP